MANVLPGCGDAALPPHCQGGEGQGVLRHGCGQGRGQ
eukprot:CAMPEP_0175279290 /NCGR_PEP_ID=MMETSP0093-20121207/49965_1 /TAXON_ID=311494 /ORGANISM="Alexandrium monilatum, Strain CCMP3105" /LENGTH=36 /DNA_ID= /DNA_START= /DNA_END= /DNA_ORIENTATION=